MSAIRRELAVLRRELAGRGFVVRRELALPRATVRSRDGVGGASVRVEFEEPSRLPGVVLVARLYDSPVTARPGVYAVRPSVRRNRKNPVTPSLHDPTAYAAAVSDVVDDEDLVTDLLRVEPPRNDLFARALAAALGGPLAGAVGDAELAEERLWLLTESVPWPTSADVVNVLALSESTNADYLVRGVEFLELLAAGTPVEWAARRVSDQAESSP